MSYVVALLALVVLVLAVLMVGVLRSHADVLRALHEMGIYLDGRAPGTTAAAGASGGENHDGTIEPIVPGTARGVPAPAHLTGVDPAGETVAVALDGTDRPILLMFLTTGCVSCQSFWDALRDRSVPGFRTIVVTRGPGEESPGAVAALAPPSVTTVMSTETWLDLAVPGAPYFVHIEDGQVLGEGVAHGWDQLVTMLGKASDDRDLAKGRGRRSRALSRRELLSPADDPARSDRDVPSGNVDR